MFRCLGCKRYFYQKPQDKHGMIEEEFATKEEMVAYSLITSQVPANNYCIDCYDKYVQPELGKILGKV